MRATTEQVNGVWQGACYPFREGLSTGILNVQFTPMGRLLCGGTKRGWPVRGIKPFALERLDWTGKMPFEVHEMRSKPDGFELTFTLPAESETLANVASYSMEAYTYIYKSGYGSPVVDRSKPIVKKAVPGKDGKSVRLYVEGLVKGNVHELKMSGIRRKGEDDALLHDVAYYTLNEIPKS